MQPSSTSSWMPSNNSSLTADNINFWSNGISRKRKVAASDLDENDNQKMFVTEEKMVKEMKTLSLDLPTANNNMPISTSPIIEEPAVNETKQHVFEREDSSDDEKEELSTENHEQTRYELHKLLRDSLKNDDLQDSLITKLCEIERKKFTMQIVPYMPIHPAQLNGDNITTDNKTEDSEEEEIIILSPDKLKDENGHHLFKRPSLPTPYTVEEPSDGVIKRSSNMKRSYSQSNQHNSNLSVTEVKHDVNDPSSLSDSQSAYFIVEPTASTLTQSSSNTSSSSLSSGGPSIRITEFIENPTLNNEFTNTLDDDDIDMQSVASSDTGDKMDDD